MRMRMRRIWTLVGLLGVLAALAGTATATYHNQDEDFGPGDECHAKAENPHRSTHKFNHVRAQAQTTCPESVDPDAIGVGGHLDYDNGSGWTQADTSDGWHFKANGDDMTLVKLTPILQSGACQNSTFIDWRIGAGHEVLKNFTWYSIGTLNEDIVPCYLP